MHIASKDYDVMVEGGIQAECTWGTISLGVSEHH